MPRRVLVASILASVCAALGCGDGGLFSLPLFSPPPPQVCAALSTSIWRIGPLPYSPSTEQLAVMVGESHSMFLEPYVEAHCTDSIASVTWSVENPSLASLVPEEPADRGSWVTGLRPGTTAVRARIVFSDGVAQEPQPRAIRVVPPDAPSGLLIKNGSVASIPVNGHAFIPFSLAQDASVLDMEIDWSSPFNRTGIGLSEGDCSAIPCPGRFILGATSDNLKPLQARALNLPAGRYNLRLDNWGPAVETIRYEVRATPK